MSAGPVTRTHAVVPPWLRGLWRRQSIAWPDGRVDDTTVVYWLQTASAFVDIRIPADRPDLRDRPSLTALDAAELACLARQGGFAGWTELAGDYCRWHREIDYQPPNGVPDEGRLRLRTDGTLIEEGVHEHYVEIWQPVACGSGAPHVGRPGHDDARDEILVVWGEVFLYARGRAAALPHAESLTALVEQGASLPALLDCDISLGVREGGRVPWEIRLSTLPFREGQSLTAAARHAASAGAPANSIAR